MKSIKDTEEKCLKVIALRLIDKIIDQVNDMDDEEKTDICKKLNGKLHIFDKDAQ